VARLKYLDAAKNDLVEIARYIARECGSRNVAVNFVGRIRAYCRKLAATETSQRGTYRSELVDGMRSEPFGNYVIFFRYVGNRLEVVNILEGHRDITAYFSNPDAE